MGGRNGDGDRREEDGFFQNLVTIFLFGDDLPFFKGNFLLENFLIFLGIFLINALIKRVFMLKTFFIGITTIMENLLELSSPYIIACFNFCNFILISRYIKFKFVYIHINMTNLNSKCYVTTCDMKIQKLIIMTN